MTLFVARHEHLLTPGRKLMTEKSMHASKVYLGKPLSFIEVTYRNIGKGLVTVV